MKNVIKGILTVMLIVLTSSYMNGQIDVEGKIRQKALEKTEQHVDEGIDKAFDAAEEGIEDAVKNEEENDEEGDATEDSDGEEQASDQQPETVTKSTQAQNAQPAYHIRYDFIPGEKVILFEDFAQDNVGIPRFVE
jgi:hypothetical protein